MTEEEAELRYSFWSQSGPAIITLTMVSVWGPPALTSNSALPASGQALTSARFGESK
jgi:hypothetical protein